MSEAVPSEEVETAPPHIRRMNTELGMLDEKVDKLSAYLNIGVTDGSIFSQNLLHQQLKAMMEYQSILNMRLKLEKANHGI